MMISHSRLPLRLLWLLLFLGPACSQQDYYLVDSPRPIQDARVGAPVSVRRDLSSFIESSPGVKYGDLVSCIRLRVLGVSRLRNIWKYADSFRVKVETLNSMQSSQNVDVCFHGNESLELGQCSKESWKPLEKGSWNGMMSPFETRFLDLRIRDSITDTPLTVSVDEEFWPFRLFFLGCGLLLLLVAPAISDWVPFYYSSAMTLGIFMIILILLFQGMKLLPTGRKSSLYLVLYGSVLGMGTVILHYFTGMVSSVLKEFGISSEAYNPVAIFLLLGIALMGAWLGYWGVRKLVLLEDGTVDVGTAQFVKWAIRVVGCVMILQSSHDPVFSLLALLIGVFLTWTIKKLQPQDLMNMWDAVLSSWPEHLSSGKLLVSLSRRGRTPSVNFSKAEFLPKDDVVAFRSHTSSLYQTPPVSSRKSHGTPPRSAILSDTSKEQEYYSSFHKTPTRRQMNRAEWADFTQQYTTKAMQDLAGSPKFADWFASNADRVVILPTEHRVDRSAEEIQTTAYMVQGDEEHVGNSRYFVH